MLFLAEIAVFVLFGYILIEIGYGLSTVESWCLITLLGVYGVITEEKVKRAMYKRISKFEEQLDKLEKED